MSLLLRRERRSLPEPIIPPYPGASIFGQVSAASPDQALQSPAVWACVKLVADIVSMLPLNAYALRDGVKVPIGAPSLLVQPSNDATLSEWLYMLVVSLLLRGNAYGIVTQVDGLGRATQIDLLHPDDVTIRQDPVTSAVFYRVKGKPVQPYRGAGEVGTLWHMRAFRMPGQVNGLSPIAYAARTLGIDLEAQKFGLDFFRSGAHPSSVLTTDSAVTQEQARTIKERFRNAVRDREPAVLGLGVKYAAVQVSPEESQFLATQKFTAAQIARFFGIPPEMIGAEGGSSMTYTNVEQRSLDLLTYGVQPWLQRIETAILPLLKPPSLVRFDTSELVRTDLLTQYKSLAIGIAAKMLTPDEARHAIDRAPLTEDDKAILDLVPLTVSPTGMPKSTNGNAAPVVDDEPDEPTPPAK